MFHPRIFQLNGTHEEESKKPDFDGPDAIIEFHCCKSIFSEMSVNISVAATAMVTESVGKLKVLIFRHGNLRSTAAVRCEYHF